MMSQRGWTWVVVACLVYAISQNSPSLGDSAQPAQEDKNHAPASKVITNDDLSSSSGQKQSDKGGQNHELDSSRVQGSEEAEASEIAGLKEGPFKANILLTHSHAAIEQWVLLPAAERSHAGRIREVTPGTKIYLPLVVTDYPFPTSEKMNLTAHVRLSSPEGKTLFDSPKFPMAIGADPRSPSVIVLNPVLDIAFDQDDLPGTYTIRVTIRDHVHFAYAKAQENLQLVHRPINPL